MRTYLFLFGTYFILKILFVNKYDVVVYNLLVNTYYIPTGLQFCVCPRASTCPKTTLRPKYVFVLWYSYYRERYNHKSFRISMSRINTGCRSLPYRLSCRLNGKANSPPLVDTVRFDRYINISSATTTRAIIPLGKTLLTFNIKLLDEADARTMPLNTNINLHNEIKHNIKKV